MDYMYYACSDKLHGVAYVATFPMSQVTCTCLLLQRFIFSNYKVAKGELAQI